MAEAEANEAAEKAARMEAAMRNFAEGMTKDAEEREAAEKVKKKKVPGASILFYHVGVLDRDARPRCVHTLLAAPPEMHRRRRRRRRHHHHHPTYHS